MAHREGPGLYPSARQNLKILKTRAFRAFRRLEAQLYQEKAKAPEKGLFCEIEAHEKEEDIEKGQKKKGPSRSLLVIFHAVPLHSHF